MSSHHNKDRWVHCGECGRNRLHYAHGLCRQCYRQTPAQCVAVLLYREKTRAHKNAQARQYSKAHKKQEAGRMRRWRKANPDKRRAIEQRRRAREAALPATLTEEQWQEILEEHNHSCAYCGRGDVGLEQEHKIPVGRGGGYTKDNIVPSCPGCNQRKYTKTYEEFICLT